MRKRYHISEEQKTEIIKARQETKNKNVDRRLKALLMYDEGKNCDEIVAATEFSATYVKKLASKYHNHGISAIVENKYGGNHRNMSIAEEEALLEPFKKAASAGQIVEVIEIKRAYEKQLGRSLGNQHGLIYYVLKRHGWRKVTPRSKHPNKAGDEAIEASKKVTMSSEARWEILPQGMFD